jgi:ATP synthase protein I
MDKWHTSVDKKARRKLKARNQKQRSVWFGFGMFGLVGWSIAAPTLIGIALGLWIDHTWPSRISWTVTLLFVGIVLGCFQAWQWIERESRHD